MTELTTQEFINTRSKVILKQIKDLREELTALRNLKSTLSGKSNNDKAKKNRINMTFQEMIIDVLNDLPSKGAEALKIIDLIKQKHGKTILRSSISPQLSRLKDKAVLELNDNIWTLSEEFIYNKNEGPAGPSDDVSASSDKNVPVPITTVRESPGGGT